MFRRGFYDAIIPVASAIGIFFGLMAMEHYLFFSTPLTRPIYTAFMDAFIR